MAGAHKLIAKSFRASMAKRTPAVKARLTAWRKGGVVQRLEGPTNPVRARTLGYKASRGYVVAVVRVGKGNRSRPAPKMGRKPGKNVKRVSPGLSLKRLAEGRVSKRFPNMAVVGAFLSGTDSVFDYYEVILKLKAPSFS